MVTGVSASLELFQRAAEAGAQMVLVHHGMFYGSGPRPPIDAREKARLKALFDADLSLVAYHLALDAHPEVGNNALLCDLLGRRPSLERVRRRSATSARSTRRSRWTTCWTRCAPRSSPTRWCSPAGPERIARIAVISGSAAGYVAAGGRRRRRLLPDRRAEGAGDERGAGGGHPLRRRRPLRAPRCSASARWATCWPSGSASSTGSSTSPIRSDRSSDTGTGASAVRALPSDSTLSAPEDHDPRT